MVYLRKTSKSDKWDCILTMDRSRSLEIAHVSTLRSGTTDELSVYDVPFHVECYEQLQIRTVKIGKSLDENQSQSFKRVLMVSTPHSGKTTLMQGIMNFIVGVSYNDDFRLSFGQDLFSKAQEYQDWTTVYQFVEYEGGKFGVPLMFIDIPRTEGSTELDVHMNKIYDIFSKVQDFFTLLGINHYLF
uniref:Uncharacterized protein LOC111103674 n=1 Tax=Crassostrea virginica TaxID=6565 RepID=A0A8B8ARI7_CRAVI|nr:uncharacterized protein LOC111103674 [Crassostrea virginica]